MSAGRVCVVALYKPGGRRNIYHWELLCADAPPHARITVGNKSLASAQQSQTASDRHNGWTTERPQTDSLVDIDVNDTCLTSTALDNSVSHQLFFFLDTDFGVGSCPAEFGRRIIFIHVALFVIISISPLGIGAFVGGLTRFF